MSISISKRSKQKDAIGYDGIWVGRTGAADILGITLGGMLLLQRDRKFMPDCRTCGRIRWKIADCVSMREELRQHLKETYPEVNDLFVDSE